MDLLQNQMVTNDIIQNNIPAYIRVQRHIAIISFYLVVKKDNQNFLVTYDIKPEWQMWYPFYYNPKGKAVNHFSSARTYSSLIKENNEYVKIDITKSILKAINYYKEIIGNVEFLIEPLNNGFLEYELKYSKSTKMYTMYRFYNFVITEISNIKIPLNPAKFNCKLINLNEVSSTLNLISDAREIVLKNINQLIKHAISID